MAVASLGAIEDCALGTAVLVLNALPQAELRFGTRSVLMVKAILLSAWPLNHFAMVKPTKVSTRKNMKRKTFASHNHPK